METDWQRWTAWLVVVITAGLMLWGWFRKKKNGCGCDSCKTEKNIPNFKS